MLLRNIYDLSDEEVVARGIEKSYMQYFTGETVFQKRPPINPATSRSSGSGLGRKGLRGCSECF